MKHCSSCCSCATPTQNTTHFITCNVTLWHNQDERRRLSSFEPEKSYLNKVAPFPRKKSHSVTDSCNQTRRPREIILFPFPYPSTFFWSRKKRKVASQAITYFPSSTRCSRSTLNEQKIINTSSRTEFYNNADPPTCAM